MKKYETPKLDIIILETKDIIATSGEYVDNPTTLTTWGSITDPVDSDKINVFK